MDTHFVSVKLYEQHDQRLPARFAPFVYGSSPLLGSWDPDSALEMMKAEEHTWELELVIPPHCEELEFNFLVRDLDNPTMWKHEDHQKHVLLLANAAQNSKGRAEFKNLKNVEELELHFFVYVENISPSELAAMWKVHKGDIQSRPIHTDSRIKEGAAVLAPEVFATSHSKEGFENRIFVDGNVARDSDIRDVTSFPNEGQLLLIADTQLSEPKPAINKPSKSISSTRSVSVQDLVILGSESEKSQVSRPEVEDGVKSNFSEMPPMDDKNDTSLLSTTKNLPTRNHSACLLADQLLVPKERRRLAIIMVNNIQLSFSSHKDI